MARIFWFCSFLAVVGSLRLSAQVDHLAIADSFGALRVYDSAMHHLLFALEQTEQASDWDQHVLCYHRLGRYTRHQYQYELSRSYAEQGLAAAFEHLDSTHRHFITLYNLRATAYLHQEKYEEAFPDLKEVERRMQFNQDSLPLETVVMHNNLAMVYTIRDDKAKSLTHYRLAAETAIELWGENNLRLGPIYNNIQMIYSRLGDVNQAMNYLNQAIKIHELNDAPPDRFARAYYNRGDLRNSYDDLHKKAIEDFEKSDSCFTLALGEAHPHRWQIQQHIALAYWKMGNMIQAAHTYQTAILDIFKDQNWRRTIRTNEEALAFLKAYYRSDFVTRYLRESDKRYYAGVIPLRLAEIYEKQDSLDKAVQQYQQVLISQIDPFTDTSLQANPVKPEYYHNGGLCLQAFKGKARILRQKAKVRQSLPMMKTAYDTYRAEEKLMDMVRNLPRMEPSILQWNENGRLYFDEILLGYLDMYLMTGDFQYLVDAFRIVEKAKSFALLLTLHQHAELQEDNIPDSLKLQERLLRSQIIELEKQSFDSHLSQTNEQKEVLEKQLFRTRSLYRSLLDQLTELTPSYSRLPTMGYDHLRESFLMEHPESAVIEYVVYQGQLGAFVLMQDELHWQALGNSDSLASWIQLFRNGLQQYWLMNIQCAKSSSGPLCAQLDSLKQVSAQQIIEYGSRLYQRLILPLEERDLPEHLIIVPDGALANLPFDALLYQKPKHQTRYGDFDYLINKYGISYAHSSRLLAEPPPRSYTRQQQQDLLIIRPFAEQDQAEQYPRLIFSQQETDYISRYWRSTLLSDEAATTEAFRNLAPNYPLIHISSHAALDMSDPRFSHIMFADGPFRMLDVYLTSIPADMVVLSACETGTGNLVQGEGIISLARACTYSGAQSVIASLWQVDDESTASLMQEFYHQLAEGQSKQEALRQAKLSILDSRDHMFAHPFFWAAMIPMGNMEPLPAYGRNSLPYSWLLLLFGLLMMALLLWRRHIRTSKGRNH
ncbi:MAG: CHAT domain-containing tetratricopeptide repeat protein [Bacteroidota bacterium]